MTNSGLGGLQPRGTVIDGNWVHEVCGVFNAVVSYTRHLEI